MTRTRPSTTHLKACFALFAAALLPASAMGQAPQDGKWQYTGTIYGYLPAIGGSTTFPTGTGGSGISVGADTLIDALKFTFMGSLDANNGKWGAFTDVIYLDLGGSKSQSRDFSIGNLAIPAGTNANLNLDIKGWLWTVAGEYRVASDPQFTMDVLAGARYFDLEQTLKYEFTGDIGPLPLPGRSGSSVVGDPVWDAIVGVKGRVALGGERKWSVPYYLDVGTGNSKRTLQGAVGLGYAFQWGQVLAMWRYIDYRFESGKRIEDMNFNGPMIGAAFRW